LNEYQSISHNSLAVYEVSSIAGNLTLTEPDPEAATPGVGEISESAEIGEPGGLQ